MNYHSKITRHPLLTPFLIWMTVLVVLTASIVIRVALNLSIYSQQVIADVTVLAISAGLLTYFGLWKRIGFLNAGSLKDIPLFIPLILFILVIYSGYSINYTGYTQISLLALAILIGFTEEIFFRGLLLESLLPVGIRKAVLLSAVLFGLPHLLKAASGIWDPYFAVATTLFAMGIGVCFAALRVRTGTIWPLIGIHILIDYSAFIRGGLEIKTYSAGLFLVDLVIGGILAVYGLYLIRKMYAGKRGCSTLV
jgi:uncharacterized protein